MKPKIIFLHILKCGGTSMRYMLLQQFGYDKIAPVPVGVASGEWGYPYTRGVNPLEFQGKITPGMVEQYDVVMSHYDWRIIERLPEHHVISLFRHPIAQLYSLYKFMRRNSDLKRMHPEMQSMGFRRWLESDSVKPLLNTQTRYMSGHGCENLDSALQNLNNRRLTFGLVEYFAESVALFNLTFGWSLRMRHDNATHGELDLDTETYDMACELQADDMVLYEVARELFLERIR